VIGYPAALVNTAVVAAVFLVLGGGAQLLERVLPAAPSGARPATAASPSTPSG